MMTAFVAGFGVSLSLIVAIGAQNAFVLRQGLRREHVLPVVAICALSDAVLISIGVSGFAALALAAPWVESFFTVAGALFLVVYGARSFRAAIKGGEALMPSADRPVPLRAALITCLALTWLNPHVYVDTVLLLGSLSQGYDRPAGFALGAMLASALFFAVLGYGARLLAGVFASPRSWQLLEVLVGLTMWAIAFKLLFL
ncbi:MAG: LysE/ArgO family amino acid transporter [Pseudomonadota bacterium]